MLIVTCLYSSCVYSIYPTTGHCERIAGTTLGRVRDGPALSAVFEMPSHVQVVASECCAFVSDSCNHCIRRLSLPPQWFVRPN